jgi:hypothetical protein
MSKPKKWPTMTVEEQEAWRENKKTKEKARNQNPERIAYQKSRNQNPERIAYQKAYRQNPEYKASRRTQEYQASQNAYLKKLRDQAAADQFFVMAGAAEQISKIKTT